MTVSKSTVRRDLEKLELEGFLKRIHGGAVIKSGLSIKTHNIILTPTYNEREKIEVGKTASSTVNDGESIFIGNGFTCTNICKNLVSKNSLTIVTSNIDCAYEMSRYTNFPLIMIGRKANYDGSNFSLNGKIALKVLDDLYFDKAFITVNGISVENGYTVDNIETSELYLKIIEHSSETIVVADYRKFDKRSLDFLRN